jgi:hypothetical protein
VHFPPSILQIKKTFGTVPYVFLHAEHVLCCRKFEICLLSDNSSFLIQCLGHSMFQKAKSKNPWQRTYSLELFNQLTCTKCGLKMIVELTKCTLLVAESWPGNLSHNLPQMEAICSKYINITSSCMETSPLYFQHSLKHWNIFLKPFSESWAPYEVILCLNVSNIAQIPPKIAFLRPKYYLSWDSLLSFTQKEYHQHSGMSSTLFVYFYSMNNYFCLTLIKSPLQVSVFLILFYCSCSSVEIFSADPTKMLLISLD